MFEHDSPTDPSEDARNAPGSNPSAPDTPNTSYSPVPAKILGDRYRIEGLLGRGGMGEVWLAYDLKLRVEVALKLLLPEVQADAGRIELLRREVRAARGVASPHVCRVFDLVEFDGRELVAMEYIDGSTLQQLLAARSPLDLVEARDLASQMLAGLQAIHDAGLVHRDLKPANVMLTRSGRAMVMDFGLAKGLGETQSLALAGTPAYMAPEAMRGGEIGPHSDLFAVGVILAEMVHPEGVRNPAELHALWEGLRQRPPKLAQGPWERTIRRAISAEPGDRFVSAAEMSRSLGDGAGRIEVDEVENPYPGLASFTEAQARFFFGRELEIEGVWKKLRQMSMLAIIGASGVGKSSFLRAGLMAAKPDDWNVVICTPGDSPFTSLGQALVSEFSADTQAMQDLFRLHEIDRSIPLLHRWRERGTQALLIVDQFEELFTLNPPETQERFAELLSRMSVEADIHVLVSMRDDFFLLCQRFAALRPLFSEPTPLSALAASDIRRALVQPARLCGYEFESEALVDEMVGEVEHERGALPLVAFAAASLWDRRDRDRGIISRRSYEEIGRVGGALAQHAEMTLEQIGFEREEIVREIFRNLVSAHRTRVVRERAELLSVFEDRAIAEEALNALIDARLLTSFELEPDRADGDGDELRHRVEIVHESLLSSWPRLVRWQTQDSDGAQIRDQLRQAADLWLQRSQSDDLLWSGTAYQEFELWRQRYPGGLSDTEAAFAEAMETSYRRHRRRRTVGALASFVFLLAVLIVVGGLLLRSMRMERKSEAHRLRLLAEEALPEDNTLALALTTKSLELEDNAEARLLALKALSRGPTRFVFEILEAPNGFYASRLSPDGTWFTVATGNQALVYRFDGSEPTVLPMPETSAPYSVSALKISPDSQHILGSAWLTEGINADPELLTTHYEIFLLWSMPEAELLKVWMPDPATVGVEQVIVFRGFLRPGTLDLILAAYDVKTEPYLWARLPFDAGDPSILGRANTTVQSLREFDLDPRGEYLVDWKDSEVFLFPLEELEVASPIHVGHHENQINAAGIDPSGRFIMSADRSGEIRVWSRDGGELVYSHRHDEKFLRFPVFDHSGTRLALTEGLRFQLAIFDLTDAGAEPMLLIPAPSHLSCLGFSPDGDWIAVQPGSNYDDLDLGQLWFYPTTHEYPKVRRVSPSDWDLFNAWFQPDDSRIAINRGVNEVWSCELFSDAPQCSLIFKHPDKRMLLEPQGVAPDERILIGSFPSGTAYLVGSDGNTIKTLEGFQDWTSTSVRPDGREAAVAGKVLQDNDVASVLRLWDLKTGEIRTLDSEHSQQIHQIAYLPGDRLISSSDAGLQLWDLSTDSFETLSERQHFWFELHPDGRYLLADTPDGVTLWDLEERTEWILPIASAEVRSLAISQDVQFIVVGQVDGDVVYWPLDHREPHLLLGHETPVLGVKVSEDNQQILAFAEDGMMRVWPVPQGSPIHTLPLEELLTLLRRQTNLRAIPDTERSEGYRLEYESFDCWENAPTW